MNALKDRLKRMGASKAWLEGGLYRYYRLRWGKAYQRELERREQLSLFAYRELAQDLPYAPEERVIDNNLYGYAQALKQYAGLQGDLRGYMEHGLYLGGIVHRDQHHWHYPRIITMSEERKEILAKALPSKNALAVGPYIHYARPLYEGEKLKEVKQGLGRTLLVYPFHSMKGVKAQYRQADFIAEIQSRRVGFDSVLVCLYYLDAREEALVQGYRQAGFKVVTAGHKFDRNFVRRMRTHLELADVTMSNGVGTQSGFCLYLGRPHYVFRQEIKQRVSKGPEWERHQQSAGKGKRAAAEKQREEIAALLGQYRENISSEQRAAIGRQWGFDQIRSPEALRRLFS